MIVSILKKIGSGQLNNGLVFLVALCLIVIVILAISVFPLTLIWGLQLLGLPVVVSWKAYLGSILIMLYLRVQFKFGNPVKNENNSKPTY
jgi:hypothetical protein